MQPDFFLWKDIIIDSSFYAKYSHNIILSYSKFHCKLNYIKYF